MTIKNVDEGIKIVKNIIGILDARNIDYWMCRGLLRHFIVTKSFGNKQSDIDFHILATDKDKVLQLTDELKTLNYLLLNNRNYKVSFYKMIDLERIEIEFVLLFINKRNPEKTWHQSKGNMFCCPVNVFNNNRVDFYGTQIRIPSPPERYLEEVYGTNWREEKNNNI